jgi:hypothetical protein
MKMKDDGDRNAEGLMIGWVGSFRARQDFLGDLDKVSSMRLDGHTASSKLTSTLTVPADTQWKTSRNSV